MGPIGKGEIWKERRKEPERETDANGMIHNIVAMGNLSGRPCCIARAGGSRLLIASLTPETVGGGGGIDIKTGAAGVELGTGSRSRSKGENKHYSDKDTEADGNYLATHHEYCTRHDVKCQEIESATATGHRKRQSHARQRIKVFVSVSLAEAKERGQAT